MVFGASTTRRNRNFNKSGDVMASLNCAEAALEPEFLPTLKLAISMATMSPQVRKLFETMVDCLEYDASLIAALKASHRELQEVVELLAQASVDQQRREVTH